MELTVEFDFPWLDLAFGEPTACKGLPTRKLLKKQK